jgi:2-oxoglutarate/2-oxoacid ferredoxin oxidoreductase subunit alpha
MQGNEGAGAVPVLDLDSVVIRFAGDSGDGMQLTGTQFTNTSAVLGNDLATLPDFPAEIRAPAGTVAGVSGFQIQIGATEIFTPGDSPDVLVAMNPAALRHNISDLTAGAIVILNRDSFDQRAFDKAGYETNPLEDGSLDGFRVYEVPLTTMTRTALDETSLSKKDKDRCKNLFALGLSYWMYGRPIDHTVEWLEAKFAKKPDLIDANVRAMKAGYYFGETAGIFAESYRVRAAEIAPGTYRNITGNQASALGFIAGARQSGLELFLGSYPITPASDILHELSKHKNHNVRTFQAEDEIAAVSSAIGAAFGGALALTSTSGPGLALKGEAMGLAHILELPLIVANIQRGGPSTGLPTKTEQADLMQCMYGRNGESPMPIVAPATPGDCFYVAIEAARIATQYMTPVMFLSDGYIANGAEPWAVPNVEDLPSFPVTFHTETENFQPYSRDEETLARPWVRPGTPGLEHRVGGLEKQNLTGNVSYDPDNHELMNKIRAEKVARIARTIPDAEVFGEEEGDVLVIGWGGTYGAIRQAVAHHQGMGHKVTHMHMRHIWPFAPNVEPMLDRFKKVAVAEINLGQLSRLLRDAFLVDTIGINKLQGKPFKIGELVARIGGLLEGGDA